MKFRRAVSVLLLLIVAAGVGGAVYWRIQQDRQRLPEGLLLANGRIEGDRITVATKLAGRVVELHAREGDEVEAGTVMARLDDKELRARLEAARKAAEAAREKVAAARAEAEQAHRDMLRLRRLAAEGTAPKRDAEAAQTAWRMARDNAEAAEKEAEAAQAKLAEVQALWEDMTIRAPAAGVVVTRIANLGEVLAPGAPLYELVDMDQLYLKVYVPERDIGRVRLGLPARVYVDALPERHFTARVRYIASRAEFTPKEVQTPDERVKLVYAVKLYFDENPGHVLTPGIPADAVIRWRDDVPWMKPRW